MLCRVEMPTNDQIFGRFYRWRILNLGGRGGRFLLIGLPVFMLAFLLFFLWLGEGIGFGLVLAAASIGYSLFALYVRPGMEFRKKDGAALQTEVYIFTENGFTRSLRSAEGGLPDNLSAQYDLLVRAVETKQDFYLFYSAERAYLVDKEYFTNGTPQDLRATLSVKMGNKFKSKI